MLRYDDLSNDLGPLWSHQSCPDCIIATRGYDFREGQPFNSAGLAVGSAVGGHTQICFASPSPAAQQVIEGRLRGLAVTSKTRSQALPNLPTTTELGYPDVTGDNWQGLVVPAGTPKQIIAFLHGETVKIVALPDIRERLAVLGFEPVASTPEEFAEHVKVEFMKWAKVIKASNIKAE
jgi:tripartite-type tricarboxylate transporter receptor subunit TctC